MSGSTECEPLRVAFFECKRSLVRYTLSTHKTNELIIDLYILLQLDNRVRFRGRKGY